MLRMSGETQISNSDKGFILPYVLAITFLFVSSALIITSSARSRIMLGNAIVENAQAAALADTATMLFAYRFGRDKSPFPDRFSCKWGDTADLTIIVQDQAGLVDINAASPRLIAALLGGLMTEAEANRVLSEWLVYRQNQRFRVIEDLDNIPSLQKNQFNVILRLTTVESESIGIDIKEAPAELLQILSAKSARSTQDYSYDYPSQKKYYGVMISADMKNGGRFQRKAVFRLTGEEGDPIDLIQWERALIDPASKTAQSPFPDACRAIGLE
jgi:hypothetical protein